MAGSYEGTSVVNVSIVSDVSVSLRAVAEEVTARSTEVAIVGCAVRSYVMKHPTRRLLEEATEPAASPEALEESIPTVEDLEAQLAASGSLSPGEKASSPLSRGGSPTPRTMQMVNSSTPRVVDLADGDIEEFIKATDGPDMNAGRMQTAYMDELRVAEKKNAVLQDSMECSNLNPDHKP